MQIAPKQAFDQARPVAASSAPLAASAPAAAPDTPSPATAPDAPALVLSPDACVSAPLRCPSPGAWRDSALSADARLMTPEGPKPAGHLLPGDHLLTRDDGPVRVLWVGQTHLSASHLAEHPDYAPISIDAGAMATAQPRRTLLLSPRAGVLCLRRDLPQGGQLMPARSLVHQDGIRVAREIRDITYVQILLETHAIILADGLEVDSLHPCRLSDRPCDTTLRASILAVLPELEHGLDLYGPEIRPRAGRGF